MNAWKKSALPPPIKQQAQTQSSTPKPTNN